MSVATLLALFVAANASDSSLLFRAASKRPGCVSVHLSTKRTSIVRSAAVATYVCAKAKGFFELSSTIGGFPVQPDSEIFDASFLGAAVFQFRSTSINPVTSGDRAEVTGLYASNASDGPPFTNEVVRAVRSFLI